MLAAPENSLAASTLETKIVSRVSPLLIHT
jgi:hypothetical protein